MLWVICYSCCHFGSLWNSSCHIKRLVDVIRHMFSSQSCSSLTYMWLSVITFLGMACCFSGIKFGFSSFLTPCTSGSLVLLILACEHVCIKKFSLFFAWKIYAFINFPVVFQNFIGIKGDRDYFTGNTVITFLTGKEIT